MHPDHDLSLPDAPVENPLAGTKYMAVAAIGRGGMGDVYLADHMELRKRFVVKLLHADMTQDPRLVDRMRVEAQSLAKIPHPAIVEVVDFGSTPAGRPFVVMERLTGTTLANEVRQRGAFDWHEAVEIVRCLLDALAATHAAGVIHRDIKLSNLFLHHAPDRPPVLKVLDFGLAKVLEGAPASAPAPLRYPTEEGIVLGTPRYLAPEAWKGKGVDHRADIYSTGVVLYCLLAGRGPWDELRARGDLLRAQVRGEFDPPSTFAPRPIPAELDRIVSRALSPSPDERYASALEFAEELASVRAASAERVGWLETTMLAPTPPASTLRTAGFTGSESLGPSGSTERDLPPTDPLGEPARHPLATEKLPTYHGPSMPEPDSTHTALRASAAETAGAGSPSGADVAAPKRSRRDPVRVLASIVLAGGVAFLIGLLAWALLGWVGGR